MNFLYIVHNSCIWIFIPFLSTVVLLYCACFFLAKSNLKGRERGRDAQKLPHKGPHQPGVG